MEHLYAVIMAGGKSVRFWPLSLKKPKPFFDLLDQKTMIRFTFERLSKLLPLNHIFVVITSSLLEMTRKEIPELPKENLIVEPEGRDTAPCIGLSTLTIFLRNREATVAFLPADHFIGDENIFLLRLQDSFHVAQKMKSIVTIGIKPSRPETGYGYIKIKGSPDPSGRCFEVERFVEKPTLEKAESFIREGGYYWNSGIFVFRAETLFEGLRIYMPDLFEGLMRIKKAIETEKFETLPSIYSQLPKISIDYGLMEKVENILMIEGDFFWDDVGTWSSLFRILEKDKSGNYKKGNVFEADTKNSLIIGDNLQVRVIGISDLIVVASEEGVLVCHMDRAQDIKRIV